MPNMVYLKESDAIGVDIYRPREVSTYLQHAMAADYPVVHDDKIIQVLSHDMSRLIAQFVLVIL